MSKLLQFIRFIILPIIIFMAENPYNKVVSNFSTYIPDSILEKLPHFIQDENFDRTITIIAIVLILISFIPFKKLFTKIKSYKDRKILNISRINKGIKSPNFIPLHDAIAKIIQQLDVKQLWKKTISLMTTLYILISNTNNVVDLNYLLYLLLFKRKY